MTHFDPTSLEQANNEYNVYERKRKRDKQMTIVETINSIKNKDETTRISYFGDYRTNVIRSHGMSYKVMRDWYIKEMDDLMGLDDDELFNDYYKKHFKVDYNKSKDYKGGE